MLECDFCGNEFKRYQKINGKKRNLGDRRYCLECSPFGENNRRELRKIEGKEEISYLRGVVDSDGSLFTRDNGAYIFSIGALDKDYIKGVESCLNSLGLEVNIRPHELENGKTIYNIQKSCKELYLKLKNIEESDIKPERYLRGYFDGDGSISQTKYGAQIKATSVDKELAKKVLRFLSEIGIDANFNHIQDAPGYCEDYYRVDFGSREDRETFLKEVGFGIDRKQKALKESL